MKRALAALALSAILAGCATAGGQDPFAYTRKPVYTGGFDLAKLATANDTQQFRVTDGSIPGLRTQIWINATSGGAHVIILDPSGKTRVDTEQPLDTTLPLDLGAWSVQVAGRPGSEGTLHILVTRA